MKILCIDIGNTSTHYGLIEGGHLYWDKQLETPLLTDLQLGLVAQLNDFDEKQHTWDGIAFCSVVPKLNNALQAIFKNEKKPLFQLTHLSCKGLTLNYPKPKEIGQDRLSNAIAAQAFYSLPVIVIDMGTTVTFDIVTEAGYEGGIIAPGLDLITRYLHEQTALLPALDPTSFEISAGIGKSTVDAMRLGCVVGFDGMIHALLERVQNELKKRYNRPAVLLATGGSQYKMPKGWLKEFSFHSYLTLLGLAEAFRRAQS